MKALVLNGYGGNKHLTITERPKPTPAPNQVLIRVSYAGLNPVDYKTRNGDLRLIRKLPFPHIMGNEVAGTIESVGNEVKKFQPGDKVYSRVDKFEMGAFAEFVAVDESFVSLAPKSISLEMAAGVPLVALTAVQSLFDYGKLRKGEKVLIHGGAGSVGRFAVQFAKQAGAEVTATGSEASRKLVKDLGADHFIDYRTEKFEDSGKKFDLVLDLVGGDTLTRSFSVVRPGGRVISIAGMPDPETARELGKGKVVQTIFALASFKSRKLAKAAQATYRFVFMHSDGAMLEKFAHAIDAKTLQVSMDRVFPLDKYAEAFDYQESGKAKGKVVLAIA